MIEKFDQSAGRILGFKISNTVTKDDYSTLLPEVEAAVQTYENIALLLEMTDFKWEAINAWGKDLKFGRKYHKKIIRMAIVGDKTWQKWLPKVAEPFYAQDARYFNSSEFDAAWHWLQEE